MEHTTLNASRSNDNDHGPVVLSETQPYSGTTINRPISDARSGTGNSSVFRYLVLRAGFPCLLPESGR